MNCPSFINVHTGADDLQYILRLLSELGLAPFWEDIGRVLSVTSLDTIKEEHEDLQRCLLEMLFDWLNMASYSTDKQPEPPCGHKLVWAIADEHGGNRYRLAESFASKIIGRLLYN